MRRASTPNVDQGGRAAHCDRDTDRATLGLVGRSARLLRRRVSRCRFERGRDFREAQRSRTPRTIAQQAMRAVSVGRRRSRGARLQRVQVGHVAARSSWTRCCRFARAERSNRDAAASGRRVPGDGILSRSSIRTSRRRRRFSTSCCRATSSVQVVSRAARVERRVLRRADDGNGTPRRRIRRT